jgi:NAD(P)-dependent dehydrogenase (short-subunit alcohol dehydrogenase family)
MSQAITAVLKNKWGTLPKDSTESFAGRNVIVTGASSGGLGYAAAAKFAKLGASKVIITARDEARGETSKSELEAKVRKQGQFEVWQLDILNVGVFNSTHKPSEYGWEEDLQVNLLSTTLMSILLLPKLKESQKHTGKIPILEFVNSGLHTTVEISPRIRDSPSILAEYNKPERYNTQKQYAYSKLLLRYVANHLAGTMTSDQIIVTSVCPGMVTTNITRDIKFPGVGLVLAITQAMLFRTADQGANTYISGATQNRELHGKFWTNDVIQPSKNVEGEENQKLEIRVWNEIVEALAKDVPEVKQLV